MNDEQFDEVPLARLRLDPENPRLPREQDWASEPEEHLLREFYRRYNLIELAYSIADKGFTPRHAEALLVIDDPRAPKRYIVVEGNRRLATLKLLTSPKYRQQVQASPAWNELAEKAAGHNLDPAPVVIYANREVLNDYLGFRHITGPTPWRPEAKARFIARLLQSGESIGEVARRIGSNHRTVRRFAEAHAVYTQALQSGVEIREVEAAFGVFYNALDQTGVRSFIGLGKQTDILRLPESPVPENSLPNLEQLIALLYGDRVAHLDKVIRESRELKMLGQVLEDERGRRTLLVNRDLHRAWHLIGGGRADLLTLLETAHQHLAEVNGRAKEYREDPEVKDEVRRIADLVADMQERYELDNH